MISRYAAATSLLMKPNTFRPPQPVLSWFAENRDGMIVGALVALAIVALMLVARLIGQRMLARETKAQQLGWRSVVGRVLAKTTILFMVMAAIDIVNRKGFELEDQVIREELEGNICRCTGYHNIVKAIASGAKAMGGKKAAA